MYTVEPCEVSEGLIVHELRGRGKLAGKLRSFETVNYSMTKKECHPPTHWPQDFMIVHLCVDVFHHLVCADRLCFQE